jgi:hypothetical protein
MTSNPRDPHFGCRVASDVLQDTSEQFDLGEDLDHLDGVWRAGAPEATIFYSARILEALTADALEAAGLSSSANVLSNLVLLQQFYLIPTTTRYWAHCLRRSPTWTDAPKPHPGCKPEIHGHFGIIVLPKPPSRTGRTSSIRCRRRDVGKAPNTGEPRRVGLPAASRRID